MAATSTTVTAVKQALVDELTSRINDTDVQVMYGRPQDAIVRSQLVHVADVSYQAAIANIRAGRKQYDEDYTIDVVFAVGAASGESVDVEATAFGLFEHLRDALADEAGVQGLGVDGVWSLTLANVTSQVDHHLNAPVAVIVATVRCRGRVE